MGDGEIKTHILGVTFHADSDSALQIIPNLGKTQLFEKLVNLAHLPLRPTQHGRLATTGLMEPDLFRLRGYVGEICPILKKSRFT